MAKTPSQLVTECRRRHKERGGIRVDVFLSPLVGEKLNGYRSKKGISRAEAIREILEKGLNDA